MPYRGLEEWSQQMGKPASEALPGRAKLLPLLWRQVNALLLVALEHIVQFLRGALVDDDRILLIVKAHASCIQVCAAHGTELAIHHHDL